MMFIEDVSISTSINMYQLVSIDLLGTIALSDSRGVSENIRYTDTRTGHFHREILGVDHGIAAATLWKITLLS